MSDLLRYDIFLFFAYKRSVEGKLLRSGTEKRIVEFFIITGSVLCFFSKIIHFWLSQIRRWVQLFSFFFFVIFIGKVDTKKKKRLLISSTKVSMCTPGVRKLIISPTFELHRRLTYRTADFYEITILYVSGLICWARARYTHFSGFYEPICVFLFFSSRAKWIALFFEVVKAFRT